MKASRPELPADLLARASTALKAAVAPIEGVQMAVLCTPDGFEMASLRMVGELKGARVAAMASSLMAMAGAVGREMGSEDCSRITFETGNSTAVFQSIKSSSPCILGLLINSNALLGRALYAASEVVQVMEQPAS